MSMLEKVVMNVWGGIPRFGRVVEEKTKNNWTYVKVSWVNDDKFKMDRQRVFELRGYDKYSDWYRIDKVSVIDVSKLISTLSEV